MESAHRLTGILTRQLGLKLALLHAARRVRAGTGKGVLRQLLEIRRLRAGPGRLRASDYYVYGVHDDARFPAGAKRQVVSWDGEEVARRVNDRTWRALCRDKLLAYLLFRSLGLPFPEVYAVYSGRRRTFGAVPCFASPAAMAEFLRDGMRYPCFGKYIDGSFGMGASLVQGYDAPTDRLRLAGGEQPTVDEYLRRYVLPRPSGYLFQQVIRQHRVLNRITGGRPGTVRLVVLLHDDGPALWRVFWKSPTGANITDNFGHGSTGNLLGEVDPQSGRVERVLQGAGARAVPAYSSHSLGTLVATHPDTGEPVQGVALPEWRASVQACLDAAAALPGLRYQGWDVALTDQGPTFLELNYASSVGQLPGGPGWYDAELAAFLRRYGSP